MRTIKLNMAHALKVHILLSILFPAVMAIEPHCSRFHYEEQLLEKLIRSEIRMETLDAAVEKVRADMEAEIQTLRDNSHFQICCNKYAHQ